MKLRKINSLSIRAAFGVAAAILLGLSGSASAATTHQKARRAAARYSIHETAKISAPAKPAHTARHAHIQTVSAPSVRRRHMASAENVARSHAAPVIKPSDADFAAAARVHTWEASQHTADSDAAPVAVATQPAAPIVHTDTHTDAHVNAHTKATSADFIHAAQPGNDLPDDAPDATPAPRPARDSVRGPKNSRAVQPPTPAVARMLPGSERETTPQLADDEAQVSPMIAPAMVPLVYNKRGRLIMPAALKGSHDILVHQNEMADAEGLDRIQDDEDLSDKIDSGQLVRIPASSMLLVDERLPDNRRYCRPWVAKFLTDIARAHYARFHTPLQVNSAVRTVEFQERLRRTNGNAAPIDGDTASPHLTGIAVDLAKHPLSQTEIAWMRGYLLPLEQQGKIDVEEEFQQSCFHLSVYQKYTPKAPGAPRSQPASGTSSILATTLR